MSNRTTLTNPPGWFFIGFLVGTASTLLSLVAGVGIALLWI